MYLPLFPLRTVLFPGMPLPLHIFEPRYRDLVNHCLMRNSPFGVTLIRSGAEVGGPAEPYLIGTSALIANVERLTGGRLNIEVVGQERFQIIALHHDEPYLTGTVNSFPLAETAQPQAQHLAQALTPWLGRYLSLLGKAAGEPFNHQHLPQDPAAVAYLAAIVAQIPLEEKQTLLSVNSASELLTREHDIYRRELSLLRAMLNNRQAQSNPAFSPN